MELITVQQQLETIIQQTDKVLAVYHEKKTNYENLEEQKKPLLAFLELQFIDSKSQAEIARKALACDEYKLHVTALNDARAEYNHAWANLKALEIKKDCLQSLNKYMN